MKTKSICLALAIVLIYPATSAQWVKQESGTDKNLYGVHFADVNTGTVVGDSGTILRTTDGGANWTLQQSGTTKPLRKVLLLSANLGWVVGDSGTIIHTTNGGASWASQNSGTAICILGVSFANAMTGWVAGWQITSYGPSYYDEGIILRTTNGGEEWTSLDTNTERVNFESVYFVNQDTGCAVGSYFYANGVSPGAILRTTNGGLSWDGNVFGGSSSNSQITGLESTGICSPTPPSGTTYRRVQFTDDLTGWILGVFWVRMSMSSGLHNSYFLNTTNAGATWSEPALVFYSTDLTSSHFANSSTGWAVGTCGAYDDTTAIWFTTDGGSTWNTQFVEHYGLRLEDICFVGNTNGWAVGESGTILHTTNGGVTSVEGEQNGVPQHYILSQNYPNPFNPSTTIKYELPTASEVRLSIYDMLGREVSVLVNERRNAGVQEVKFEASNLASGVYVYRLTAGDFVQSKSLIVLK